MENLIRNELFMVFKHLPTKGLLVVKGKRVLYGRKAWTVPILSRTSSLTEEIKIIRDLTGHDVRNIALIS